MAGCGDWGQWYATPSGSNGNGWMQVQDSFCDGDNGIIAALYKWTGSWTTVNLVSVRGCGSTNTNNVKSEDNGSPAYGQDIKLSVCKLLPNGTWKDCHDTLRRNW